MELRLTLLFAMLMPAIAFGVPELRCEPLQLPMALDMKLLRSLIVQQAYTGSGETVRVLDAGDGCNQVTLSAPQVQVVQGQLRFQTTIRLQLGTPVGGECYMPIAWQGFEVLWQRPRINEEWQLSFTTVRSVLLDSNGKSATLSSFAWNQVKGHVHNYLNRITIDLRPSVQNVQSFLVSLFDTAHRDVGKSFLESMRPDQPTLTDNEVRVNILADIATNRQPRKDVPVVIASPEELAGLMELWQTWDAFLVHLITQFSDQPLSESDRDILMEVLLAVRYAFEDAINSNNVTNDLIRKQFLWSWQYLEPLFHRHLLDAPSGNLLGHLSFFTAVDTLAILDRLGPSMGIEINREGFHRLAKLISSNPDACLQLPPGVSTQLRKIFGLGELLPEVVPKKKEKENNEPTSWYRSPDDWKIWGLFVFSSKAWAGGFKAPGLKEIRSWTSAGTPAGELLKKITSVLTQAVMTQLKELESLQGDSAWFQKMVLATAWQESCFRQFHVKKKKLTYLLSYNQSSVGVMQINERIWRGIYGREQLRWDIRYNAKAGAEILTLYLKRINREQKVPTLSSKAKKRFLAVWLYSLYNGGPAQLKKLPKRYNQKQIFKSEKLFLDKYDQVLGGNWMNLVKCL